MAMVVGGFSAGKSDRVRKALALKKRSLMSEVVQHWEDGTDETMEEHWINGAVRNGYGHRVAERIWDDLCNVSHLTFSKAHSVGYATLVMQTTWLKAHYPKEYMAAIHASRTSDMVGPSPYWVKRFTPSQGDRHG